MTRSKRRCAFIDLPNVTWPFMAPGRQQVLSPWAG